MNLILFDLSELQNVDDSFTCFLQPKDRRAEHMRKILKLVEGDCFKAGILNGELLTGKVSKVLPTGEFQVELFRKQDAPNSTEDFTISLILACPRPKSLQRLYSMFSQLKLANVFIVQGERVEKSFFSSHVTSDAVLVKSQLLKGLEQACHTSLPNVEFHANYKAISTVLEKLQDETYFKYLCHPYDSEELLPTTLNDLKQSMESSKPKHIVLALGAEGGWWDNEIELFKTNGFKCVKFSDLIFTTELAIITSVAITKEALKRSLSEEILAK
jgi:16S rRNA (uracil1498-N3)-methyltransferase